MSDWCLMSADNRRVQRKAILPIGTCVEGIRVEFSTPGYKNTSILAIANIKNSKYQTNVARSAIELDANNEILSDIYDVYKDYVQEQMDRLEDQDYAQSWAVSEGRYLMRPLIYDDYSNSRIEPIDEDVLIHRLAHLKCLALENEGVRQIVSAEDVAELEEINIFECEMTRAGEYLLKEVRSSATLSSHVITNQYFFEPQFSEMEYYMDMKDALDEISGFWGHVGIKLCGIDKYMWYPINSNTRKMIYKGIDEELMVIPCMNNKVLFLNMSNIEDITLSDFDADTPSGKNWDEHVSCGEIPLVVYEALEDYEENSQVTLYNDTENSTELYKYLMEYVRKNGWTEEDIFQLLNTSVFYYLDGRKKSTIIDFYQDSDDIIETIEMVYGYDFTDIEQNFMFYIDAHDETENFVNLKGISMMELPLLKVEEEIFRRNDQ